ncbi:MAG: S-layer homology domain-containing protein [Clostridia bacterium]|nr:S-layer homology domain-containing protein [Clostridia bacterium]
MTKREKFMLLLLLVVALIFSFYYFILQYQLDDMTNLKDDITAQKSQIKNYTMTKASIENLNTNIANQEEVLTQVYASYLKDLYQEEIILLINEIILRSNVEVTDIGFEDFNPNMITSLNYEVMPVNLSVTGDYTDVVNFVSSFWRFDHNIFVRQLSLSQSDVVEGVPILSADLELAFMKVDIPYASDVSLFEWYDDVFYMKEDPFDASDITLLFKPNYFYTGTDVAFYNPPYDGFADIQGHWANEVFNFFGRNGYLTGDENNNINPDAPMTRLETVVLLDLVFRWELSDDLVSLDSFADYEEIETLTDLEKKTLLKAYNSGYLFGYDDNTLRPYNQITYQELGYIGANLLKDETVTWAPVAKEIMERFNYESPGLTDETLPASKAEIVYFLAYIAEQQ